MIDLTHFDFQALVAMHK